MYISIYIHMYMNVHLKLEMSRYSVTNGPKDKDTHMFVHVCIYSYICIFMYVHMFEMRLQWKEWEWKRGSKK